MVTNENRDQVGLSTILNRLDPYVVKITAQKKACESKPLKDSIQSNVSHLTE